MTGAPARQNRFLVIAPVGRDCELIRTLLRSMRYASDCAKRLGEVTETHLSELAGLILTDEALAGDGFEHLCALIKSQPFWSDLPVILLTSGQSEPRNAGIASQLRTEISSLFLLDRPVRMESMLSAVQVAYHSRTKQFEVREAATKQSQSDEALRNSEKLATAGRLAATLAHEVNNPLEAMSNLLYLIQNSASLDQAKAICETATQELQRISDIVNRTLRFHRASASPEWIDVAEVAGSAVALFRNKLAQQRIQVYVSGDSTTAYCSAGEIRQAVVNLIGNAIDAMPHGGNLYVRVARVRLHGANYARITVGDTGSGIPSDIRANVFKQFFTTKGSRGTGLGLWLTQDIVSRSRGILRMRSSTGKPSGTVFSIYLPMRQPLQIEPTQSSETRDGLTAVGAA